METIRLSSNQINALKDLIILFKEIDGDENKALQLEDLYALTEISRDINLILEPAIRKSND